MDKAKEVVWGYYVMCGSGEVVREEVLASDGEQVEHPNGEWNQASHVHLTEANAKAAAGWPATSPLRKAIEAFDARYGGLCRATKEYDAILAALGGEDA